MLMNKCLFFFLKILKKSRIIIPTIVFDVDYKSRIDSKKLLKNKILFVEGWYFRRHDLVTKYDDFFSKNPP